ncbi:hypothetical protein [Gordonia sp. NPDC003376]
MQIGILLVYVAFLIIMPIAGLLVPVAVAVTQTLVEVIGMVIYVRAVPTLVPAR